MISLQQIGAALFDPVTNLADPGSRLYWGSLLGSLVLAFVVYALTRPPGRRWSWRAALRFLFPREVWLHPSALMDVRLMIVKGVIRTLLIAPWAISAYGLAVGMVRYLNQSLGMAPPLGWTPVWVTVVYTLVLFVCWDISRYLLHRWLHRVPWLWRFHKVHHSAEVLTPFTLFRTHPVESFLFTLRGTLVTGLVTGVFFYLFQNQAVQWQLLGVNAGGFLFNMVGGNLRHSHVWLSYGRRLEHLLISPAQHQIHHSKAREHHDRNFGTWLALWDWLGGSLVTTGKKQVLEFGLDEQEHNHDPRSAISAVVGPLKLIAPGKRGWLHLVRKPAAIATFLLLLPGLAAGQAGTITGPVTTPVSEYDLQLDTVSIIGRADQAPRIAGSAHVVDTEELERRESNDIHKILDQVPGVYVRGEDGYGLRPNIGLRGANSDRSAKVALMEDGVLLAPAPYAAPAAYYFPMPTRLVGVEVFKGPAATRYGPNTIGGAINLLTRSVPNQPEGELDVSYGLDRTGKVHGHWGASRNGWGVLLEGVHMQSHGFKELDGGGNTGFEKNDVMAKVRYHSDPIGKLFHQIEFKGGYGDELGHETYLGLTDADFAANPVRRYAASQNGLMTWWRSQGEVRYFLAKDNLFDFQATLYRHDFTRAWAKLNRFRGGPPLKQILEFPESGANGVFAAVLRGEQDSTTQGESLLIGTNDRSYVSQGLGLLSHWRPTWGPVGNEFEFGLRVHQDYIERNHTEEAYVMRSGILVPEGTPIDTTTRNRGEALALAVHLHDQLEIGDWLFSPGVRMEVIERDFTDRLAGSRDGDLDVIWIPGVGAHYQVVDQLGVFAGVHKGFSPVSPGQADDVRPEESINYEGGARMLLQDTMVEAIGFFNDYSNLTGECTLSTGCNEALLNQQFNGGAVWVYGLEALASQAFNFAGGWGLRFDGSYTLTMSQFRTVFISGSSQFGSVSEGDALPYVAEHQGGLKGLAVWQDLEVGLTATMVGDMRDVPGSGAIPQLEKIERHTIVDLNAAYTVRERARLYLLAENLFNTAYAVSRRPYGLRPGRPLHVEAGARVSF